MGNGSKRLLVIGIDQAIPYLLNKFHEGRIDIAPTLSHILQIPKTLNSQGRILHEVLE
jgi:hypothetical protein